jgi:hypothetical protein
MASGGGGCDAVRGSGRGGWVLACEVVSDCNSSDFADEPLAGSAGRLVMPGPRPPGSDLAADRTRDLLDSVVSSVLTVGLSLEAAIDLPGEAAGQYISEALRCLDEVVREVRDHVFAEQGQGGEGGYATRPRPDLRDRAEVNSNNAALLQERMASLRQRVILTANALQVAAAETVSLLERRDGLLEPPTRIDFPAEITRWRVFADQARQVAERLERLQNQ